MKSTDQANRFLPAIRSHFDKLLAHGLANFGPSPCAMWMASLDTRTGRYPEDDARPAHIPRRHYRAIDAPKGCSLYWDQPAAAAASALSLATGNPKYQRAANAYVGAFLERCLAQNGMFLWGNHYYWGAFQGQTMKFRGEETPQPVDFEVENGSYHEARPIPPTWDLFWRISPEKTERQIRVFTANSLFDAEAGGFNRHADGGNGCAFLESGGIMMEALAWLRRRTGDASLLDTAQRLVDFSYGHRHRETGLLENNPTVERWDKFACTTEVGLWAGCLLRAARGCDGRQDWIDKALAALSAYLERAYDPEQRKYWGRLRVADGAPIMGTQGVGTDSDLSIKHQPGDYSDIWRPLFPAHDYPMPLAECCLSAYELTDDEQYRVACERWVGQIADSLPAGGGRGAYAEHYGRVVHFLWRCGRTLGAPECSELASQVADEAVAALFDNDMFRGHPGEHRYDAVDGVGYLVLALLALATGDEPDMMGSGW